MGRTYDAVKRHARIRKRGEKRDVILLVDLRSNFNIANITNCTGRRTLSNGGGLSLSVPESNVPGLAWAFLYVQNLIAGSSLFPVGLRLRQPGGLAEISRWCQPPEYRPMMTSAPAGATDQNTYRPSNSTPCRWRSYRYSSRNVRVRWCSSWFSM